MNIEHDSVGDVFDVIVCGAGPAGLASACGLANAGLRVAVCGYRPAHSPSNPDMRTAALFVPAISYLKSLCVWDKLAPSCTALYGIRMIDDTGDLLRAPETLFHAADAGLDVLGYNCPNTDIVDVLSATLASDGRVACFFECHIEAVVHDGAGDDGPVSVYLTSPREQRRVRLSARLVVAADGRRSLARDAAQISTRQWDCRQSALTAQFTHSRPHDGISTEFHRKGGPVTVVPMPGNRSALVWLDRPGAVGRLMDLDEDAFRRALEARLHGLLGQVSDVSLRRTFPLTGHVATSMAANRTALVGEAAHAFPPIGAQGLNLSLRDVAALADVAAEACKVGDDPGSNRVLDLFARRRRADVASRAYGVDLLGASLTSVFLPASLLRGAVLHTLNAIPGLKRRAIEQGLGAQTSSAGFTLAPRVPVEN